MKDKIPWSDIADIATSVGAVIGLASVVITAIGVLFALKQLKVTQNIAQTEFENSIDQQYRQIIQNIPVDILIGKDHIAQGDVRELIFNYLDLCNEQIYLYSKSRISEERWGDWSSGIKLNLQNKAFLSVWDEVRDGASLTYLEDFLAGSF
ncbi:hypothetical protein P3377_18980 [Vibrio parahaemolyticus]|nr:hypothetical protein [Vibrio parahaemolyticus]HAS6629946.1 hypothetical protein [Vibrio parahaemolyticus]